MDDANRLAVLVLLVIAVIVLVAVVDRFQRCAAGETTYCLRYMGDSTLSRVSDLSAVYRCDVIGSSSSRHRDLLNP